VFFEILRTWCDLKRHGTARTSEFITLSEELSGIDLGELFSQWLDQRKLPKIPHRTKRD